MTILDRFSRKMIDDSPDKGTSIKRVLTKAESTPGKFMMKEDSMDLDMIREESCVISNRSDKE